MKKKITAITVLLFVVVLCCVLTACADPHEHELQHFEAKEPTCSEKGNIEYWYCAGCGKYFADNTAKHELKKIDTVISASNNHIWGDWVAEGNISCTTGGIFYRTCAVCGCKETETFPAGSHELSYIEEVSPSCTVAGIMAHWHCNVCGKNYADEKCSDELNTVEIEKLEHKPEYVAAKDATCGEEGNKSYWICIRCNSTFSDKECDNPVDLLDLIIPETENHIFAEEWVMTKEPTKTEQGLKARKCHNCSYALTMEVNTIDYEYTEDLTYVINKEKTGYTVRHNSGTIIDDATIAPHAVYEGLPVVGIDDISYIYATNVSCIIIPETVKTLGYEAATGFSAINEGLDNLRTVIVSEDNPYFTSDDGVVYSKDKSELVLYPSAKSAYEFNVPDTVKVIKEGAFWEAPITFLNLNEGLEIFERGSSFSGLVRANIPSTIKYLSFLGDIKMNPIPETIEFIGTSGVIRSSDNFTWYKNGWYWGSENNQYFALVGRRYLNVNIEVHPQTEIIAAGVGAGVSVYYGETFVIPDSVRIVCGKLFNSGGVDNIEIGKNAYFYDENPFSGMVRIKKFSVDPENPYYTTDDKGVLYSKDFKTLICYPGHSDYTSYTINEQCEEIAMGAFAATDFNHLMLQKITIPENVVKIGDDAFEGVFFKNKGLTDVYYQGNLSGWAEIDFGTNYSNPMAYADNLYINGKLLQGEIIIPEGTEKIGDNAFYNCSGLTSIAIPDSVTSIGEDAFRYCSGLTSITIPDSVTSIGSGAFRDCSGLTSITIPDSVTSIGEYAFSGYRTFNNLTSITIGKSVTSVGYHAFYICGNLTDVYYQGNLSGWLEIEFGDYFSNPMYYADNLYINGELLQGDIIIPEGTEKIGDYAFYNCSGLTNISIPDSVTSIGSRAFYGCSGLTSITIPDSVTSIKDYTFYGCSGLTSITIPDSVTSIGQSAFSGCSGLTSITIPDSVTSIGENAFYGCRGLTSITIPDSVISIGSSAFYNCSGLTSITIPNSVTSIGDYVFRGCSGLTSITIPDSVTSIGRYAFSGCSGLTSITIPDSVTSIGSYAFSGCSGLTSITVEQGNAVYHSAGNCIIETASGTLIAGCKNSVIPNDGSVTSIESYAFFNCSNLTSITIPDGVTSIGDYAFYNCVGLTSITIPDSVTSIGDGAFSGCSGLTSITIPDCVTSIGWDAFFGCSSLTSVTIPDSVTSISGRAFSGCSGLTSVKFNGTMAQWKAISKGSWWADYTGDFTITCTDGVLDKEGNQI